MSLPPSVFRKAFFLRANYRRQQNEMSPRAEGVLVINLKGKSLFSKKYLRIEHAKRTRISYFLVLVFHFSPTCDFDMMFFSLLGSGYWGMRKATFCICMCFFIKHRQHEVCIKTESAKKIIFLLFLSDMRGKCNRGAKLYGSRKACAEVNCCPGRGKARRWKTRHSSLTNTVVHYCWSLFIFSLK